MKKTINVNNFMSLRGFSLKPSLRNVLVGPNLAGKSNIIRALKFLTHISVPGLGLATAVNSYGGFSEILWKGIDEGEISFFLSAEIFLSEKDKPRNYEYELSLIGSAITGSFVIGNEKLIRRDDGAEYILAENVDIGLKVQKYGRTTALTKGAVNAINATINVGYSSGTARFVNQIVVYARKPFIKAGDSGSLLVTDPEKKPVGLLFAGTADGKWAIANRINLVLDRFGVTIDGSKSTGDLR